MPTLPDFVMNDTSLRSIAERLRVISTQPSIDVTELAEVHSDLACRVGPQEAVSIWRTGGVTFDGSPTSSQVLTVAAAVDFCVPPQPQKPIMVTLGDHEIIYAQMIAAVRHTQDLRENRTPRFGDPNKMLWFNTVGCFGEMAVAKHLGIYWNGAIGDYKAGDVGVLQVRTSTVDNSLSVYDWDKGDWFIAVTGVAPTLKIIGCFMGQYAKRPEFARREHNMAIFKVPQHRLWPLEMLLTNMRLHATS